MESASGPWPPRVRRRHLCQVPALKVPFRGRRRSVRVNGQSLKFRGPVHRERRKEVLDLFAGPPGAFWANRDLLFVFCQGRINVIIHSRLSSAARELYEVVHAYKSSQEQQELRASPGPSPNGGLPLASIPSKACPHTPRGNISLLQLLLSHLSLCINHVARIRPPGRTQTATPKKPRPCTLRSLSPRLPVA